MFTKITNLTLIALAIAMIIIGIRLKILPPVLTGLGFVIIALNFLRKKS